MTGDPVTGSCYGCESLASGLYLSAKEKKPPNILLVCRKDLLFSCEIHFWWKNKSIKWLNTKFKTRINDPSRVCGSKRSLGLISPCEYSACLHFFLSFYSLTIKKRCLESVRRSGVLKACCKTRVRGKDTDRPLLCIWMTHQKTQLDPAARPTERNNEEALTHNKLPPAW